MTHLVSHMRTFSLRTPARYAQSAPPVSTGRARSGPRMWLSSPTCLPPVSHLSLSYTRTRRHSRAVGIEYRKPR